MWALRIALPALKCDHAKTIKWLRAVKEFKKQKFCQAAKQTLFLGLLCADKKALGLLNILSVLNCLPNIV